jgi:hypothetical protein
MRLWQLSDSFDWRDQLMVSRVSDEVLSHALSTMLPSQQRDTVWNLIEEKRYDILGSWSKAFVDAGEFQFTEPARCRHGRTHVGCLGSYGIQRDAFGKELPLRNRSAPPRVEYPPTWYAPIRLRPGDCRSCTLLIDDGNLAPDTQPDVPDDNDLYLQVGLERMVAILRAVLEEEEGHETREMSGETG